MRDDLISIGELRERTGVATSALRFYETEGLIHSTRSAGGQRRYHREVMRRVSFIRIAQKVGLSLEQIRESLVSLPESRTPTKADWARLSKAWRPQLEEHIAMLQKLRDELTECIGCGCLSLRSCALYNGEDRAATLGPGGVAEGLARGSLCIDMSTAPPGLARELAEALAPLGVDALDAPVSGGTIGAEAGILTIMVGGAEAAVERARPVLEAMGELVVHVGDHGLGQAAKLCNNLCAGINMAAIAQAVALARREGLDPVVLYELMSNSTGDSRVLRTRFPATVSHTTPAAHGFAPMFTVDLMEKDLALAEQLAAEHGLEAEPLAAALALYRRAQGEGHGSLDYSAIALTTGGAEL